MQISGLQVVSIRQGFRLFSSTVNCRNLSLFESKLQNLTNSGYHQRTMSKHVYNILTAGIPLFFLSIFGTTGLAADQVAGRLPVQIEVVSQLRSEQGKANYAFLSPYEEYLHFSELLKKTLETVKWDGDADYEFIIKRFPAKLDSEYPRITVYLHDWRSFRDGEIRAYFGAVAKSGSQSKELGSFAAYSSLSPAPIRSLRDASYDEAMLKACRKFAKALNPFLLNWEQPGQGGSRD